MKRKRLFDLTLAILGLLILVPILFFIAVWIKLDSKGPVLFKQKRVGHKEKHFYVYKFRTMVPDAEKKGLQLTTAKDIRVTRPGKFLRKYKLDELPQLINVLKGEMSLVGPRPEVPRYVEHYPDSMRKIIFSVPPGITDLASIEFKDENTLLQESRNPEETYIREILPIKLEYYTEYVQNRSVKGDLKIIIKTIKSLLC